MNNEMKDIPPGIFREALWQWFIVSTVMLVPWLLTYFPMGLLVAYFTKPMVNVHGERYARHSDKYIAEGSSGNWLFEGVDIPIIEWWSNLEDGELGEPSGKWSAFRKGKEATFWSKYAWACRNPFNKLKRTSGYFACFVNDCELRYWGDKDVTDKVYGKDGGYFILARSKKTGKVYYGYRKIVSYDNLNWYIKLKGIIAKTPFLKRYASIMDNRIYQPTIGYKIKPCHIGAIQDSDDLDKAFTARIQFWAKVN